MADIVLMKNPLGARDSFRQIADQPYEMAWQIGQVGAPARATIAIPTYKRIDTLVEAINSAVAQRGVSPPDVVIVDNDGPGEKPDIVRAALSDCKGCRVRYFVNSTNIGMFGNWNRSIMLAETPWVTILNDDDLLHETYLQHSLAALNRLSEADGIVCRKGVRDRRAVVPDIKASSPQPLWLGLARAIAQRVHKLPYSDGVLKVTVKRQFFGNLLGNGLGFLFRRDTAVRLGGYDPDDFPSADFLFYLRMADDGALYLLDEVLADVGIGDNESIAPGILQRFVTQVHEVREHLAGNAVPRSWMKMAPMLASNHVRLTELGWGEKLDPDALSEELGFPLPPPSPLREALFRLRYGAL